MRRTDKEFKEEVLRRSRKYRAEQAKRRRTVLMTAACVLIIAVGVQGLLPHSFKAADNAAPESMKQDAADAGLENIVTMLMRRIRASSDVTMAHARQVQRAHERRGEHVPLNIPLRGGIDGESESVLK